MAETTDELITVEEDDLITAETTNKNNKYLESLMTNYAGELRQYLDSKIATIEKIPVGTTAYFSGRTAPNGWLICDGSAISRETYAALFEVIGITYGAGNGATTFNLPNAIGKFFEGSDTAGIEKQAGLPNITGSFITRPNNNPSGDGAFYSTWSQESDGLETSGGGYRPQGRGVTYLNVSRSSSIYGNSSTVQPPAITQLPIIKY